MQDTLVAVTMLALRQWTNEDLAVLNNAFNGCGFVDVNCRVFAMAIASRLITDRGAPLEGVKEACVADVIRRIRGGTWG